MDFETTVTRYTDSCKATLRLARSPLVWAPFAVLAALKTAALVLMYYFWHPSFSGFMIPALQSLFGEEVLHYPLHLVRLPQMFRAVDTAITLVCGYVLVGWAIVMMADRLKGHPAQTTRWIVPTLFLVPSFIALGIVIAAGVKGVPMLCVHLKDSIANTRFQALVGLSGWAVTLIVKGVLLFAPTYLILSRGRVASAIVMSWRYARRWSWLTGLIVLTPWILQAPLDYLLWTPARLLQTTGSGFVLFTLMLSVLADTLGFFFLSASATAIVLEDADRAERKR